jgi:hypothetical protein
MILGTEAVGVLNIGSDQSTVYGPASYVFDEKGNLEISIASVYNNLYNATASYNQVDNASLEISGQSQWGFIYTEESLPKLKISGIGIVGFVYNRVDTASLKIHADSGYTALYNNFQPISLKLSAQSLMNGYTFNVQEYDQQPVKLKISGTSVDFYLSVADRGTGTGTGNSGPVQIWIG